MLKTLVSVFVFLFIIGGILGSFLLIQKTGLKETENVEKIIETRNINVEKEINK